MNHMLVNFTSKNFIFNYFKVFWQFFIAYFSLGLIVLGSLFIISGIVGIIRFKDFFARIHANGIIESCGIPILLIGVALQQHEGENAIKMIGLALIILIVSPLNTHILAKAAFSQIKK